MSIVVVRYRFLKLSSNLFALVEIYPNNPEPQICQELYPVKPYLTDNRINAVRSMMSGWKSYQDWISDCFRGYESAVEEAKDHYCTIYDLEKQKQLLLLNCLEPYWDEFVPLFDSEYNPILRSFNEY